MPLPRNSVLYAFLFAGAVCAVCSFVVTGAATILKDRQAFNARLDKQTKVLAVGGIIDGEDAVDDAEATALYQARVDVEIIDFETGEPAPEDAIEAPESFDQVVAMTDPALSVAVVDNPAGIQRVPIHAAVYKILSEDGQVEAYVFPVQGKGLWSTLYGYFALEKDLNTVRGITFYKHGETPGLGGEVDNPAWKGRWPGRKLYNEDMEPELRVIKGAAPPPDAQPYAVDGLSGATITANGVSSLIQFWMGENGYLPYIKRVKSEGGTE